jgi:membrane protease YdiL (CAAX protease family)
MSEFQKNHIKNNLTRYLPARSLLTLLVLFIFIGILLGSIFTWIIFYFEETTFEEILKKAPSELNLHYRNLMRWITLINHSLTFLFPSILLVYLLEKSNWLSYLQLTKSPRPYNIGLSILLILAAFPLTQFIFWINKQIPLSKLFQQWEESSETAINGLIIMEGPMELLFSLFVMAILPALGEEFLFRGILQKNLEKIFKSGHAAVWLAAFIFSAFHFQFMGFLPRFFLGILLGYLFLWTRNLWIPIIAHLIYNGIQVLAAYRLGDQIESLKANTDQPLPIGIIIFSFIFVATSIYAIYKFNRIEVSEP